MLVLLLLCGGVCLLLLLRQMLRWEAIKTSQEFNVYLLMLWFLSGLILFQLLLQMHASEMYVITTTLEKANQRLTEFTQSIQSQQRDHAHRLLAIETHLATSVVKPRSWWQWR